jgi:hypothetical protein
LPKSVSEACSDDISAVAWASIAALTAAITSSATSALPRRMEWASMRSSTSLPPATFADTVPSSESPSPSTLGTVKAFCDTLPVAADSDSNI